MVTKCAVLCRQENTLLLLLLIKQMVRCAVSVREYAAAVDKADGEMQLLSLCDGRQDEAGAALGTLDN